MRSSSMLSLVSLTLRSPAFCARFAAAVLCLGLGGCGGGSSDPVVPPLQPAPPVAPPAATPPLPANPVAAVVPRFAYAGDANDLTISIYAVDAQSGQLRANGYVVAGVGVREVAVDPSNTFVYALVGVGINAGVFVARINAETGAADASYRQPVCDGQCARRHCRASGRALRLRHRQQLGQRLCIRYRLVQRRRHAGCRQSVRCRRLSEVGCRRSDRKVCLCGEQGVGQCFSFQDR